MASLGLNLKATEVNKDVRCNLPIQKKADGLLSRLEQVATGALVASPIHAKNVLEPKEGSLWHSPKKSPESASSQPTLTPAAVTPGTAAARRLRAIAIVSKNINADDAEEATLKEPAKFENARGSSRVSAETLLPPIHEKSILSINATAERIQLRQLVVFNAQPSRSGSQQDLQAAASDSSSVPSRPQSAQGLSVLGSRVVMHCRSVPVGKFSSLDRYTEAFFHQALKINPLIQRPQFNKLILGLSQILCRIRETDFLSKFIVREEAADRKELRKEDISFIRFRSAISRLQEILIESGIQGPPTDKRRQFCFWTGQEAQKIANSHDYICDDKVPMISYLVECWKCIDKSDELHHQMPYLFSLIYANLAKDDVVVYVSSVNIEGKAVLNSNSSFWVELNVLINNPAVISIQTFFIEKKEASSKWLGPFDLKTQTLTDCADVVQLSRRGDETSVTIPRVAGMISRWQSSIRPASAPPSQSNPTSKSFADLVLERMAKK